MPYDKTTGIIDHNGAVGIGDLQQALGTTSRDLGDLCSDRKSGGFANVIVADATGAKKHVLNKAGKRVIYGSHAPQERINKWARHRSFSYPVWDFGSASDRDAAMVGKNYGFSLSQIPTSRNAVNFYNNGMYATPWPVEYPRGGAMSPARALDFQGYMTTWRMREIIGGGGGDNYIYPVPGASCYVDAPDRICGSEDVVHFDMVAIDSVYDDYLITLDKLSEMLIGQGAHPLAEWYIGFALIGGSASDIYFCYTDLRPKDVDDGLYVQSRTFGDIRGTYSVAPILVSDIPNGMVFRDHTAPWMSLSGHWPMDASGNMLDVITIDGRVIEGVTLDPSATSFNVSISSISVGGSSVNISGRISNTTNGPVTVYELMGYLVSEYIVDYRAFDLEMIRSAINSYVAGGAPANVINEEMKIVGRYVNFMNAAFSIAKNADGTLTVPKGGRVNFSLNITDMGDGYAGTIAAEPSAGLYSPASIVYGGLRKGTQSSPREHWEYEY